MTADNAAVCSGRGTVEAVAVEQLLALARGLVQEGVGFLGCQKCLHQKVREYLEEQVGAHITSVIVFLVCILVHSCVACFPASVCRMWWLWIVCLPFTSAL